MKIYNSYQEAKIANQEKDIFSLQGKYTCGGYEPLHPDSQGCYLTHCEPSDYLMSVAMFLDSGYKISAGDTFIDTDGKVETMTEIDALNNCINDDDNKRYILKSAWIKDKIPTESPQEREALDMIDATSKQVESLANDSELPNSSEWDGEGLPPVGVECCFTPDNNLWGFASTDTYSGEVLRYEGEQFVFLLSHDKYNIRPCHLIVSRTDKGEFSKPESPEQKAERERLEAAYDLCTTVYPDFSGFDEFKKSTTTVNLWLAIVDKTGYRKVNQ